MTAAGRATGGASRYQVLGRLATGGMGEILLARRRGPAGFEKLVVLKRPLANAARSRALVAALIEEARLLARINHPNVCQIHDLEEAEGQYFLALEHLEGLSLWTLLVEAEAARRPPDPLIVCALFEQVCDGLDAIHSLHNPDGSPARVVHRDISPGNLFVTESGTVKILDFGIAKTAQSEARTPFGNIKGKLPYLAPEQAAGRPLDARADVFSLGLVLYDVARGIRPPNDRIGALARDALDLASVPAPLAPIIDRATRIDPAARFPSARDLAASLRTAATALGSPPNRATLADWLARSFPQALADARERTRAALAGETEPSTITRTLTLHSVFAVEDDLADADAGGSAAAAMLSRQTERLQLPVDELPRRPSSPPPSPPVAAPLRSRATDLGLAPELPGSPRRARRRVVAITAALAAAVVVALGFVAVRLVAPDRPTPNGSSIAGSPATPGPTSISLPTTAASAGERMASSGERTTSSEARTTSSEGRTASSGDPTSSSGARATSSDATTSVIKASDVRSRGAIRAKAKKRPRAESDARAVAEATPGGFLTVNSFPFAQVTIAGKTYTTPETRIPLAAGRHRLHATRSDGREQDVGFEIEAGRERRLVLQWSER